MPMLDTLDAPDARAPADRGDAERMALVRSLDMAELWRACSTLVSRALPCHSCSLLFDIDGYRPQQGRHHLADAGDGSARLVTSLDVAAPYLDANPRIPWYTFSQIALGDAHAGERLRAQDPAPGWREFIHLAFWNGTRLEAVLSIRVRAGLSELERAFLAELYPLLDASLQRVRMLEAERGRQQALETWLHQLPIAVVLVDAQLLPSYMSREARRLCRHWDEGTEAKGRLPRPIERALRRWLAGASGASPMRGGDASLSIEHPQRAGQRLRLDIGAAPAHSPHAQHVLVLTPDDGTGGAIEAGTAHALPLLKALSPSERKVALLVAAGLRNEAIAQRLCRSRKTIESQISSIFRKLDVASRTQLARLLA